MFVDFQGAFDNLEWKSVIGRLREIGCEEMGLWESYFSERRVCMVGVCGEVWKDVQRGCPQGSICGPFIWNLMMDGLLWRLRERGCKVVAYADDLLMIVDGQNRMELERKGTEWMGIVSEWGVNVGVNVSKEKTVAMLLKGRLSVERPPGVCVNERRVKYVTSVKYLGVWMGERMSFRPHLECMRRKCVSVVGKLRRVLRSEWGLRKRAVRMIYNGMFVASVMYGASVWYGMMRYEYARKMVNRCQRVVLSACLNVCRTVSTEAMQVLMGGLPWDLECVRRGVRYKIKNGLRMDEWDRIGEQEVREKGVSESVRLLEERLYDEWQRRWDTSEKGRVTHGFVRSVRFASECEKFEPSLWLGYILTGHGSTNGFLYERGLSDTEECVCGAEREDWKHVLTECRMYEDVRDLNGWGVTVSEDGGVDVSRVLEREGAYESLSGYARCVFERRRERLRGRE